MMLDPMSPSRKCPHCGADHRPGVTVCPREVFRAGASLSAGPYRADDNEATLKRAPDSEPTQAPFSPLVEGVPAAYAARMMKWEESVTRDMLVGKQVGDYVLKRRIGSGGMGIVYEGEHAVIGRKVAIKVLRPDFAEGGRARDLATEARAASAIHHHGIIDIFGFGTIPDVGQYMVMEYLEGAPLDEVILRRAPMLELEVIQILEALLGALAAAHAVGVIHRDLKPGNVFMVREEGRGEAIKVLDFGIAKRSEAPHGSTPQTHANAMVGTPEYIAPEQACGQQVSPQTDLYAVGVIAYEMLTRRLPFQGETPLAIVLQHVRTPPPRLSSYVELNPALESLVLRLLAKEPSARPASAEAVRRELKQIRMDLFGSATKLSTQPLETHAPDLTPVAPPSPAKGERFAKRAGRARGVAPARRPHGSDSDAATSIMVRPTQFLEATTLDLATIRSGRSRKMLMGLAGVLMLVVGAGGWALLSSARAASESNGAERSRMGRGASEREAGRRQAREEGTDAREPTGRR
ncbi:serine/threonine-protein kinase [Myxococcus sp. CA039A]|uniref:serine/threonine-protein kinase n=1 Tax=Myxococcus sp. CA039A TaxID=2741737 RepID=UPI00157A9C97|nr:serine/threonine-protein kinase [Myxococcus sp. CA039A]NTX57876.1 serine/threonine protein kinase [Myxococcus sp. CA039A]